MALTRASVKGYQHDEQEARLGMPWGAGPWPDGLAEEHRTAQARMRLLRSRVRDVELRRIVEQLSTLLGAAALQRKEEVATKAYKESSKLLADVLDRAGKIVREIDDA